LLTPVERITHDEVVKAIGSMKTRKVPGPSEVNTEMVIASGETESIQFNSNGLFAHKLKKS